MKESRPRVVIVPRPDAPADPRAAWAPAGFAVSEFPLSDHEFNEIRSLVYARTGIALGPHKRHLVRARLNRRLRALGLASFADYMTYLIDPEGDPDEMGRFVNAITTNKTEFFREPHHFTHLGGPWAAARKRAADSRSSRRLRLWSAACSTGEEPYTLAMTLAEAGLVPPTWDVRILASDIDTDVLAQAEAGAYRVERVAPVPPELRRKYFLRRDRGDHVEIRQDLRDLITFRRINLAESSWPIRTRFDVIFCRNTLIYFDRAMQRAILQRLVSYLAPGGLLFLGHAESVFGLVDGLLHLGNTMYTLASEPRPGGSP